MSETTISYPFSVSVAVPQPRPPQLTVPAWLADFPIGAWSEIPNSGPVDLATGRWRQSIEQAYIEAGLLTAEAPADITYGRIGGIGEFSGAGFRRISSTILLMGGGGAGAGASNGVCGLSLNVDVPTWKQIVMPTHASQLWHRGVGPTNEYMRNGEPNSQHSGNRPVYIDLDDMMIVAGTAQTWELDAGNFSNVNSWTWGERSWHCRVTDPFIDPVYGMIGNPLRAVNPLTGDWWGIVDAAQSIMRWTRTAAPDPATPWIPVGHYTQLWKRFVTQSPRQTGGTMCVDTDRGVLMIVMGFNWAIDINDPTHCSPEGFRFGGPDGAHFDQYTLSSLAYVPQSVGGAYAGRFMIYDWGRSRLFALENTGSIDQWEATELRSPQVPPSSGGNEGYSRFIADPTLRCLYVVTGVPPSGDLHANIWAFRLA